MVKRDNQQRACGSAVSPELQIEQIRAKNQWNLIKAQFLIDFEHSRVRLARFSRLSRLMIITFLLCLYEKAAGMPRFAEIPVARAEILASEPAHNKNCKRKLGMSWANPVKRAIPANHSTTLQIKKPTASHLAMTMHLIWNSVHLHPLNQFSKTLAFFSSSCYWKRRLEVHENSHVIRQNLLD